MLAQHHPVVRRQSHVMLSVFTLLCTLPHHIMLVLPQQINNAGILHREWDKAILDSTIKTNYDGPVNITYQLLPHLAQGALVIMVSSRKWRILIANTLLSGYILMHLCIDCYCSNANQLLIAHGLCHQWFLCSATSAAAGAVNVIKHYYASLLPESLTAALPLYLCDCISLSDI